MWYTFHTIFDLPGIFSFLKKNNVFTRTCVAGHDVHVLHYLHSMIKVVGTITSHLTYSPAYTYCCQRKSLPVFDNPLYCCCGCGCHLCWALCNRRERWIEASIRIPGLYMYEYLQPVGCTKKYLTHNVAEIAEIGKRPARRELHRASCSIEWKTTSAVSSTHCIPLQTQLSRMKNRHGHGVCCKCAVSVL